MNSFESPKSSIVRKVWYNPGTQILSVQLADKNKRNKMLKKPLTKRDRPKGYIYLGVPRETFTRFSRARSKGHFFTKNIRGQFMYQQDVFCAANSIG